MTTVELGRDLRVILDAAGFGAHDSEALDVRLRSRGPQGTSASSAPTNALPGAQGWAAEPAGARRISDLDVIGGREAIARLREIDPNVKAIVSSGYSSDPVLANYRAHSFCGVVAKPYRFDDFGRVLRAALAEANGG